MKFQRSMRHQRHTSLLGQCDMFFGPGEGEPPGGGPGNGAATMHRLILRSQVVVAVVVVSQPTSCWRRRASGCQVELMGCRRNNPTCTNPAAGCSLVTQSPKKPMIPLKYPNKTSTLKKTGRQEGQEHAPPSCTRRAPTTTTACQPSQQQPQTSQSCGTATTANRADRKAVGTAPARPVCTHSPTLAHIATSSHTREQPV